MKNTDYTDEVNHLYEKLLLDAERIVYRFYLGEGMSALGAKAP